MNDEGYTLAEMLTAMVMISLVVGGLTQGVHVIGQIQGRATRAITEERATRDTQARLERLLGRAGPFSSDGPPRFQGGANGFSFDCGAASPCGASLTPVGPAVQLDVVEPSEHAHGPLPVSVTEARFVYGAARGVSDRWPPTDQGPVRLEWVGLRSGASASGVPIAGVRLLTEEPRACAFDAIAQRCRDAAR